MIITKQKPLEDVLGDIASKPVFLVGCSQCATLCHTGGNEELIALKKQLSSKNIPVSGHVVLDPACHRLNNKRILKDNVEELEKSEKILVLACGNGVQTISGLFPEKQIIAGTDTLFLGEYSTPRSIKNDASCAENVSLTSLEGSARSVNAQNPC